MSGWKFSLTPKKVPQIETKYRKIATKLPVPESLEIFKTLNQCESISMHGQLPVVWDRAEDFRVHDPWGNSWIDFTSTIFVTNAGHGNKEVVKALNKLLDKPLLHSYTFATLIRAKFLKKLIEISPSRFEKCFLLSAGTEATECALKLMRMFAMKKGKRRPGIIALEGNWHGRTMGAQMMSDNKKQKEWIGYQDPNIFYLPFPYPWRQIDNPRDFFHESIEELIQREGLNPCKDICGFMLETFQGWGAVFYPEEYIQEIRIFADENDILIAFDEMQSGFARTGKFFGYMHYGIDPDLICCGKGASSSLPLSFVLGPSEIMDLPEIGSMSSTHSANPLCCAAGLANLNFILDNNLAERSRKLGDNFFDHLKKIKSKYHHVISWVLGKGLVAAVHFNDIDGNPLNDFASIICEKAMQKGLLLVHTGRESIKLAPPLTIEEDALEEGLAVLDEAIYEAMEESL